jgi:hypothetical protein
MNTQHFSLQPFTGGAPVPPFAITGAISRSGTHLTITYNLTGSLQDLVIAPPADKPARRWVLWETTCFEFFLALQEAAGYWEFNLSPAGTWNVFRLTGYRQGLEEDPAFQTLPFTVHRQPEMLALTLKVDLAAILPADRPLKVAISTVLEHQDGRLSYWALTHPGPEPDFHRREGFVIKLSPSQ